MIIFYNFPLFMLPNFSELIIKRLSTDEVDEFKKNAKVCSVWEADIRSLKEWLVWDLGSWFLVRWA